MNCRRLLILRERLKLWTSREAVKGMSVERDKKLCSVYPCRGVRGKVPWSVDRFADCLKPFAKQDKISELIERCGKIDSSSSPLRRAEFVKCLMDNFERQFPEDVRVRVMENCGRNACVCIGMTLGRTEKQRNALLNFSSILSMC